MAELIMTDEEKHSKKFLEWDDASLGRAVKMVALICDDDNGKDAIKATGAAVFLISEAIRSGATELTIDLKGASNSEKNLGDWKITMEKIVENSIQLSLLFASNHRNDASIKNAKNICGQLGMNVISSGAASLCCQVSSIQFENLFGIEAPKENKSVSENPSGFEPTVNLIIPKLLQGIVEIISIEPSFQRH
jgi:hypothetical protein